MISKKSDGQDSDETIVDQLRLEKMQKNGQHKKSLIMISVVIFDVFFGDLDT